jgi:hypothetical protein
MALEYPVQLAAARIEEIARAHADVIEVYLHCQSYKQTAFVYLALATGRVLHGSPIRTLGTDTASAAAWKIPPRMCLSREWVPNKGISVFLKRSRRSWILFTKDARNSRRNALKGAVQWSCWSGVSCAQGRRATSRKNLGTSVSTKRCRTPC